MSVTPSPPTRSVARSISDGGTAAIVELRNLVHQPHCMLQKGAVTQTHEGLGAESQTHSATCGLYEGLNNHFLLVAATAVVRQIRRTTPWIASGEAPR